MVSDVEHEYLGLYEVDALVKRAKKQVAGESLAAIELQKAAWISGKERDRNAGIKDTYIRQPSWKKNRQDWIKDVADQKRDIIRENALIFLSLGLRYLDFVDACRGGYSARVEKCIQCFAVVFQGSAAKSYAGETLHLVACLTRVWNANFKRAWQYYCLINPSGRPGKFISDDLYGEEVIRLNKQMIRPSANAKTDEFHRETLALNVQTLLEVKDAMARATGATRQGNRHSVAKSDRDVAFVVNLLLEQAPFQEVLGRGSGENGETKSADLFKQGTAALASCKPLRNYLQRARGNWNGQIQLL